MDAKRILLAEDEPNIVAPLQYLLRRAGYAVDVYDDGQDALDAVLDSPPDVLVLDVMLPRMDGFEILKNLREDARTRDLPVLMLTAKGQREDRERALKTGANLFITKPFANAELIAAVDQLAGASQTDEAHG